MILTPFSYYYLKFISRLAFNPSALVKFMLLTVVCGYWYFSILFWQCKFLWPQYQKVYREIYDKRYKREF